MKKITTVLLLLCWILVSLFTIPVAAYSNPMILEEEWPRYSIGDPFILKYNGRYYLYVSTKDTQVGVKCWQSENLVDWSYAGLCATDPVTTTAYAPEVLYYNGYFYMYTSPGGKGHYILKSESPTGPFEPVTGNLGMSIDGSAFVDDDGTIYFLHAAVGQLDGCVLSTPSQVKADSAFSIPISINNAWTEGPTLFKRNGRYYITYTGNHVIHDSYRVEYATSKAPVSGYTEPEQNILLLNTDGPNKGLGHNSVVIGPDLDTYYIVYHSLESANGPLRHLNLDRILWNGDQLCVQATAGVETENPALPDYRESFSDTDGWKSIKPLWLTEEASASVYTAEYNWKLEGKAGTFGVYFAYTDENNYGKLTVNADTRTLTVELAADGQVQKTESTELTRTFAFDKLHTFTIRQTADTLLIQLDQQQKFLLSHTSTGGRIGYYTETADFYAGYTAFSNKAMGSHDYDTVKNFPSTIEAVHANTASAGAVKVPAAEGDNSFAYRLGSGGWLDFSIVMAEADIYSLGIRGSIPEGESASLRLILDEDIMWDDIRLTPQAEDGYSTWVLRGLQLPAGSHTLRLLLKEGSMEAYEITGALTGNISDDADGEIQSDITAQNWLFYDEGTIYEKDASLIFSTTGSFAKALQGNTDWADYTVQTNVTLRNGTGAGLLLRAQNATDGLADNLGFRSSFSHQGYYVSLEEGAVKLYKHYYNSVLLYTQDAEIKTRTTYTLTVRAEGADITVFVDGQELFTYTDNAQPFLTGMAGIKTEASTATFTDFSVTPLSSERLTVTAQAYDHAVLEEQPAPLDQKNTAGNHTWLYLLLTGCALVLLTGVFSIWYMRHRSGKTK